MTRTILVVGVLVALLVWESLHPCLDQFRGSKKVRGLHLMRNFSIALINALMVSFVFVALWTAAAYFAKAQQFGLLYFLPDQPLLRALLAIVLLDAWTYAWHWMNHRVPWLWRFHRVHHSDAQMDVSTASRFHFGEIAASSLLRIPIILLLGIQIHELVIYEAMMFAVVQFHHANVRLPEWFDKLLRVFIVTPAMHKVHHSRAVDETNSNYTSFLSFWDRLFGTFRLRADSRSIRFGLEEFESPSDQTLVGLVKMPVRQMRSTSRSYLAYFGLLAAVTLVAVAGAYSLGRSAEVRWQAVKVKIARDFPEIRSISTTDLDAWMRDRSVRQPILLDVREAKEFAISHLPGATHIKPGATPVQFSSVYAKDMPIVVYCSVGYRSAAMARWLTKDGFTNVTNLDGSIFQWANEGRRLVQNGESVDIVHPYDEQWGLLLRDKSRARSTN